MITAREVRTSLRQKEAAEREALKQKWERLRREVLPSLLAEVDSQIRCASNSPHKYYSIDYYLPTERCDIEPFHYELSEILCIALRDYGFKASAHYCGNDRHRYVHIKF